MTTTVTNLATGDTITEAWVDAVYNDIVSIDASRAALIAAYSTWTPTLVQSVAVTKTTTVAKYQAGSKQVSGAVVLTCTGAGTAANAVVVGLPTAALSNNTNQVLGEGYIFDTSTGFYWFGLLQLLTTTTAKLMYRGSGGAAIYLGAAAPWALALASGDVVAYNFDYEAA